MSDGPGVGEGAPQSYLKKDSFVSPEMSNGEKGVANAIQVKLFPSSHDESKIAHVTTEISGAHDEKRLEGTRFGAFKDSEGGSHFVAAVAREPSAHNPITSAGEWYVRSLDPSGQVSYFEVHRSVWEQTKPEDKGKLFTKGTLYTPPPGEEDEIRTQWEESGGYKRPHIPLTAAEGPNLLDPQRQPKPARGWDAKSRDLSEEELSRLAERLNTSEFDPDMTDAATQYLVGQGGTKDF